MVDQDERAEFQTVGRFVLERKDYFLTYPKVKIPFPELEEGLSGIGEYEYLIACHEKHKDGSDHMHAYIIYKKARKVNERTFDLYDFDITDYGQKGSVAHPNIGKPRNRFACINYCKKEGEYKEFGTAPVEKVVVNGKRKRDGPSGREMMDKAKEVEWEDFLVWCIDEDINVHLAEKVYSTANGDVEEFTIRDEYEIPVGATIDDKLLAINMEEVKSRRKCLVITGRSGAGKTQTALKIAPKPCLLVSHIDDLKKLKKWHKSIVFDDMKFTHYPAQSRIHLVDYLSPRTRSINVKYGTCQLASDQYRIFTCNSHPLISESVSTVGPLGVTYAVKIGDTSEERAAIERRIERIHI